jgi:hypothetical protein
VKSKEEAADQRRALVQELAAIKRRLREQGYSRLIYFIADIERRDEIEQLLTKDLA